MDFLTTQPGIPSLSEAQAQTVAEDMARLGIPAGEINAKLKGMGYRELDMSPAAEAERQLGALKNDPDWVAKFHRGDHEVQAQFNRLTLAMTQGGPNAEPAPSVDDYKFDLRRVPEGEQQQRMQSESAQWAADLKLPENVASVVIEYVLDNVQRTGLMSPDEKVNHGEQELAQLRSVLAKSGDPDTRLKEAQKTIKLHSGRDIDIAGVTRTNGARAAMELLLHSDALAFRNSR